MILCHTCAGVLTEPYAPLYTCDCKSGYIRGFEQELNPTEALDAQLTAVNATIASYRTQGRKLSHRKWHMHQALKRQASLTDLQSFLDTE